MSEMAWNDIGTTSPRDLGPARHQAHNAVQWLARIASSYIDPVEDQSHTSLGWDAVKSAFETGEIAPGLTVEYRVPDSTMQFKEGGERVTHQILLDDRSPAEVEAWFLIELLHRHMDRDRFSKDLPYELADLMVGDAVHYEYEPIAAGLDELAKWYANGAGLLDVITSENPGASPVRCWPHGFDISTEIGFGNGAGDEAKSISVGLSPGDEHYDEPYFFVTPKPRLSPWELPELPDLGHWHKKGFVGAVVPASSIVERNAGAEDVLAFLRAAIEAGKTHIGA